MGLNTPSCLFVDDLDAVTIADPDELCIGAVEEYPPARDVEQFHCQFHVSNPFLIEFEVLNYLRESGHEGSWGGSGRRIDLCEGWYSRLRCGPAHHCSVVEADRQVVVV